MYRQESKRNPFNNRRQGFQPRSRSRSPMSKSPTNRSLTNHSSSFSTTCDHLWGSLQQMEIFPAFCLQLLRNEDKNLRRFKTTIESEKKKIYNLMESFSTQINHIIEDLKLSLLASVDQVYKMYMEKYSQFKSDLLQINRMKEEMSHEISPSTALKNPQRNRHKSKVNNEHTINLIENTHDQFRKYHVMKYISELQKEKLLPVREIGEQLMILTQYENGFIQGEEFKNRADPITHNLRVTFHDLIKHKYEFFRQPEYLFMKQKEEASTQILKNQYKQTQPLPKPVQPEFKPPQPQYKPEYKPEYKSEYKPEYKPEYREMPISDVTLYKKSEPAQQIQAHQTYQAHSYFSGTTARESTTDLKLSLTKTIKCPYDIILCAIPVKENLVVVGSRDGTLTFYDGNGKVIKSAREHKSSVCTLSLINNGALVASGSDHPHSEILLWDLSTLEVKARFREHKAAVTAIQCLLDGVHMVSGSYDKKICIYNYWQNALKYTLPSNKSSITSIVINYTGSKMISCGLDNTINVWQIITRQNVVETMFLEQIIENNSMICSLTTSIKEEHILYIGTKDGKVKIVNIQKGQSMKSINCCNNAVIEIVVLEYTSARNPMLICWPCKEKCVKVVNSANGKISTQAIKGYLEFSCGVGPKATVQDDGMKLMMVSQGEDRELTFYDVVPKQ